MTESGFEGRQTEREDRDWTVNTQSWGEMAGPQARVRGVVGTRRVEETRGVDGPGEGGEGTDKPRDERDSEKQEAARFQA